MTHCERTGKIAYASAQEAWKVIRARNSERSRHHHKHRAVEGNAYRCPVCHAWPITRQGLSTSPRYIPWEITA